MMNNWKQAFHKLKQSPGELTTNQILHHTDNVEGILMNKELGHIIEKALDEIPEIYRMVFVLRELNQHNVEETAEILNITLTNVKVRLNRAKEMIRAKIENQYSGEHIYSFNAVYCDRMVKRVLEKVL